MVRNLIGSVTKGTSITIFLQKNRGSEGGSHSEGDYDFSNEKSNRFSVRKSYSGRISTNNLIEIKINESPSRREPGLLCFNEISNEQDR